MSRAGTTVAMLAMLLGCAPTAPLDRIQAGIEGEATCAELFDIRNELDPDSPDVERANEMLRDIGCFSAQSNRTD